MKRPSSPPPVAPSLPTSRSIEYLEGSFGTHLLSDDISVEPVMFGHGGHGELLPGHGLGVVVRDDVLESYAESIARVGG